MKSLILKDLMVLKQSLVYYLLFMVFYAVLLGNSVMYSMVGGMLMMFMVMLPITAMSYDERAKWDRYALTMPLTRRDLVLGKYLLGLLLAAVGLTATLAYQALKGVPLAENLAVSAALFGVAMFYHSILTPMVYKFGVENGRLMMMAAFFAPAALIFAVSRLGGLSSAPRLLTTLADAITAQPWLFAALAATLVVAVLFCSFRLSLAFFAAKDL